MSATKLRHPRPRRAGNHSTFGEKSSERIHGIVAGIFGGRKISTLLAVIGGMVAIVAACVWFYTVYSNPKNVFWGMVQNNLSTPSVTKEITQKSTNATSTEITQMAFYSNPSVRDTKEIDNTVSGSTSRIKIESIGTPSDTYQRYVLIEQQAKAGKPKADFSKVYAMWLKNGGNAQAASAQLFNNAVFSGFLFGDLPRAPRTQAINYMQKAYKVDYANVNKKSDNARKTYTYNVTLSLRDYAKGAHFYAETLKLPNAKQISVNNYKATDKLTMSVTVDVLSRQLRQITYTSNGSGEKYTAYGNIPTFGIPKHTVSYNDLQQAVNKAAVH
jgi:hypothetical protein